MSKIVIKKSNYIPNRISKKDIAKKLSIINIIQPVILDNIEVVSTKKKKK
jgi:hypothetical protein